MTATPHLPHPGAAFAAGPGLEAQPSPCLSCGAPMDTRQAAGLHANPTLVCPYCRREEALPADAAERHRHLRLRLMQLQRARDGLEAPVRSYQMLRQTFPMAGLFAAIFGGWQLYNFFTVQIESVDRLRQAGLQDVYYQSVFFAAFGPGVVVGLIVGWVAMTRTFARLVRPLMTARAPLSAGLAARCRSCGGDLPPVRAPQVQCRFCSATNLLDTTLTHDASRLLHDEAEQYRSQALGGGKPNSKAFYAPSRAFYVWGGIGAVVSTLLLSVAILLM